MSADTNSVFVWRETQEQDAWERNCPWCKTPNLLLRGPEDDDVNVHRRCECPLCGWYSSRYIFLMKTTGLFEGIYRIAVLRSFDLNSIQLSIEEVGSHVRRSFSDVYSLDWRRFEEVVQGIFRHCGFETVLTQRTRDGGADILLLSNGEVYSIVECKKYARSRTLGINAVRALVGACVDWEVNRAFLVTTTNATKPAVLKAEELRAKGYEIDLIAATELAQLLEVYNTQLPGLQDLGQRERAQIIEKSRGGIPPGWREQ